MAEAKEYKQRVEELESVLPRRSGLRERKDVVDQSEEIEKLQDDLRQCENKLRKYVQHSERLEKDRKGVIDAISSCDVADVVGDSVVEMVVSLCEKLTSIEEECMALVSSEGKASEYLSELDALREKYSELEAEVKVYEAEDAKMAIALADCKANLKKAEEKLISLSKDNELLKSMAESAKGNISELQNERRRQMQYLENENLQLGDELKRAKKELAEAKFTVTAFQNDAFSGEPTEELRGLSTLLGGASSSSSTKRAPIESASKRGSYASAESGSKRNIHSSSSNRLPPSLLSPSRVSNTLTSSRKRSPESPVSDEGDTTMDAAKENLLNKKQRIISSSTPSSPSPFGSEKKKRIANPFSSVKKAARRLKDNTPTKQYALGDSEPTVDVTGECKQS
jgi:predicted  nucleic acid-binding Zn-ribbon protein